MIGVQALIVSCCLVAQAADSPTLTPPSLSKRKFGSAPAAAGQPESQQHRPGHSAYDRGGSQDAAERLLKDVDAGGGMAGEHLTEMGQVGLGAASISGRRNCWPTLCRVRTKVRSGPSPCRWSTPWPGPAIARRSGGSR